MLAIVPPVLRAMTRESTDGSEFFYCPGTAGKNRHDRYNAQLDLGIACNSQSRLDRIRCKRSDLSAQVAEDLLLSLGLPRSSGQSSDRRGGR